MTCHVCREKTHKIFCAKVLNKYSVTYYQCSYCRFIQTEEPYWLKEAYSNAIASLDVGLVGRNLHMADVTELIIRKTFDPLGRFLDYAGGYGLLVRLMRDKGFDFYRQDPFCENLFAKYLDLKDLPSGQRFELLTAFEVFEHLENPLVEIEVMFSYSDSILFSTELQPNDNIRSPEDWHYFVPETGQHLSFYSLAALRYIADHFKGYFYSNDTNIHLLTLKPLPFDPFKTSTQKNQGNFQLKPLVSRDFEFVRAKLLNSDTNNLQ